MLSFHHGHPLIWVCLGTLLLTPAVWAESGDIPPPAPTVWENAGRELLLAAEAPARGTWPGYLAAAGCGGALALSLRHDADWYRAVQDRRNAWQDQVMPVATLLGDGWFHIGAYAALYEFGGPQDRRAAGMAVEGQIGVAVVSTLVKTIFSATRPEENSDRRQWFTGRLGDTSFASGHAMTAFCAATILGDVYHVPWLTYPLAGLVAYSRVYNNAHWPADTIAGAGLGVLLGSAVLALHAAEPGESAIRFVAIPQGDGATAVLTWRY